MTSEAPELLLSALAERERLLRQERISASHAATLMKAMDVLHASEVPDEAIVQVLKTARDATGAGLAVLLSREEHGSVVTRLATEARVNQLQWRIDPAILGQARRVTDLSQTHFFCDLPRVLGAYRSFLSVPVAVAGEAPMAIALLSLANAKFSRVDQQLLQRIAALLERAFDRLRLTHRNAVLARIVSRELDTPAIGHFADPSFDVLSRAFAHVVEWQRNIVDITNKLLNARSGAIDPAITTALARTGALARSDRTYVFRLRAPDRLDNTHEWVADGIEPMIEQLQDMPDSILDDWRPSLERGHPIDIPDVSALPEGSDVRDVLQMQGIRSLLAVPMMLDGRLTGFVGYDAVRRLRRFLPVEIELLQSVANAIGVVLDRASAEAQAQAANQSLKQERDRFRATLAAIPDLVVELDADGRFVSYGAGAQVAPTYPLDAIMHRMPEEVLPQSLARLGREIMAVVDTEGYASGYRYPMVVDGRQRWFEVSAAAKSTVEGGGGYVFLVHDITNSHHQQSQIRRLGRIAELTSNLVIVTDAEGQIDWVNPAFCLRSGWAMQEVRGRKPGDFLHSSRTDPNTVERIDQALRAVQPVQVQILHQGRSGGEYWTTLDIQPLFDDDGHLDGYVWVQTDITELQEAHQRALKVRALAMETASDGIAISDADGRYIFMNEAHRKMFGVGLDEDVSLLTWKDFVTPAEKERFLAQEWPVLASKGTWRGELAGLHRDGTLVHQEVTLSCTEEGGLVCFTRDISEQRALKLERSKLREDLQLAQRRETIAQLASGVAHDLNNLVAVVSGTVTLLESQAEGKPELCAGLNRIARAMDAARDLVSGLGRSARPNAPRRSLDLRQVMAEAIDLLGSERRKKHDLQVDLPDTAQPVWANHTELLQVILNLALNACEAAADGSAHVALGVGASESRSIPARKPDVGEIDPGRSYSLFSITDSGAGLDPAIRDKLFESYVTTKGDAGTGMGLAIVAGIVRDNSSALWFDSEPGAGVTVSVAWPEAMQHTRTLRSPARTDAGPDTLAGHRILVVDDVVDVADVLSEMLEMGGAVSIAVSDPQEALALLIENPGLWSAVVTDLDMRGINGIDIAKAAARSDPPVPAVLVTALPERVGADGDLFCGILSKPVEAGALLGHVRAAVSSRPEISAPSPDQR